MLVNIGKGYKHLFYELYQVSDFSAAESDNVLLFLFLFYEVFTGYKACMQIYIIITYFLINFQAWFVNG